MTLGREGKATGPLLVRSDWHPVHAEHDSSLASKSGRTESWSYRKLVVQKAGRTESWSYRNGTFRIEKKHGRLCIRQVVNDLAFRFARHNTALGCDGIQGELANLGYPNCNTTESHILKSVGIDPVPSLTSPATNHSLPSFLRLGKISSLMNSETSFTSRSPDVFLSARLKKTPR